MNASDTAAPRHDLPIDSPPRAAGPRSPLRSGRALAGHQRWRLIAFGALAVAAVVFAFNERRFATAEAPTLAVAAMSASSEPHTTTATLSTGAPNDAPAGATLVAASQLLDRDVRRSPADEAELLEIYGLIATGQGDAALPRARRLAAERPSFGLAQLAYADLLNVQSSSAAAGFGATAIELSAAARERLADLTAEARARVQAAGFAPPAGTVPEPFVLLDPSVRHAIAVDVSRSRVYVIENDTRGPRLLREYYASIGKLGMLKQSAGDQRTPLGVYFVTREVPAKQRADRYGSRALVLNYPNPYDRIEGRSGDSIWLHGIPPNAYARAPWATDGCIAMTNAQIEELAQFITPQGTPILVTEHLEWAAPSATRARQADFMATLERWRAARDAAQPAALQAFYSTALKVPEVPSMGAPWRPLLQEEQRQHAVASAPRAIEALSIVRWKDQRELMVVTFSEKGDTAEPGLRTRRQYWVKEDGGWHIFYERLLG